MIKTFYGLRRNKGNNYPFKQTENTTIKQTLNGACPTAQRLALSVREFTGTLQSHPLFRNKIILFDSMQ